MHITKEAASTGGWKDPVQSRRDRHERIQGKDTRQANQISPGNAKTSGWRKYPGKRSVSIASMPDTIQNVYEDRTVSWP
jgi:hypothetical protein